MLNRIKELGLLSLVEKAARQEIDEKQYQIKMAAELRRLTLLYFQGKLSSIIPDGPAVVELRKNFKSNEVAFSRRILNEWAQHEELVMLSELLDSSLIVYKYDTSKESHFRMNLSSRVSDITKDEIELYNHNGQHWSAVVPSGTFDKTDISVLANKQILPTLGDNYCASNAVSLILKNRIEESILSPDTALKNNSTNIADRVSRPEPICPASDSYAKMIHRLEENAKAGDVKSEKILKQIENDAKLAVKLSLEQGRLPAVEKKPSVLGFYSKPAPVAEDKTSTSSFLPRFSLTK
ncbi:MAG: hypothetical protein LRY69_03335 [Gammaproteobacteria bacterium]|nr:hypothetical protein [Gammaproteobacteria bacterium]